MTQDLKIGIYEDARALVGTVRQVSEASGPVNEAMIRLFASVSEDANRSYWDDGFARKQWGGVVSPPSMLVHWVLPPPWSPGEASGGPLAAPILMASVPLPGDTLINISVDYSYLRPVRVGDRLRMVEELVDISPEKTTRLGTGHFITTSATFYVQDDEVVATQTNVMFRYDSGRADA